MPVRGADLHSYEREREMLFGMIFNLQSRIDQLTERLDSSSPRIAKLLEAGRHEIGADSFPTSLVVREPSADNDSEQPPCSDVGYDEVTDVPPTLEANEREVIRRALLRNDGRRKAAAAELKISERTLYRKIKEYDLDRI